MNKPASLFAALLLASAHFTCSATPSLPVSHNQQQIGIIGPSGESHLDYADEDRDPEADRASAAALRIASAEDHAGLGGQLLSYK